MKGKPPVGAVAADSAAKKAGPDFFSCTRVRAQDQSPPTSLEEEGSTSEQATANRLWRTPLPMAAFANRTLYKVSHAQALLKEISHIRNALFV